MEQLYLKRKSGCLPVEKLVIPWLVQTMFQSARHWTSCSINCFVNMWDREKAMARQGKAILFV